LGANTAATLAAAASGTAATAGAGEGIPSLTAGTGGEFAGASLLEPVSVANPGSFLTNYSAIPTAPEPNWFMKNIVGQSAVPEQTVLTDSAGKVLREAAVAQPGSGFLGLGTGAKLGIGVGALSALPLLMPEEEEKPLPGTTQAERDSSKSSS
jgi:hypothetical protein